MEINKIYCESNLETMKRMPDNFIDIVITSPPYNLGKGRAYKGGLDYEEYEDNLSKEKYFEQTKIWINELLRVTKYHIFWNIQEVKGNRGIVKFLINEFEENLKETFIWAKTNPAPGLVPTMVTNSMEYIFCFSKDEPKSKKFNYCNFNNRETNNQAYNVLIKPINSGNIETLGHSFCFGDWLPDYFINKFSKENDLIYDPFMGMGTTAKSAIKYKRNFIGSEMTKKYVDLANKRLQPYLDQQTLF
jgi:site-specific DNA-methyltransferase (adenine-specific)/modification methylase